MKYIKLVIIIIFSLLVTGCWNYHELNNVAIVGSMGIDIENDEYIVSVGVINSKTVSNNGGSGSTTNESPTIIYESNGKTINEALKNIILISPLKLYLGHMNLLVIGEDAAKKGIQNFIDYLMSDSEVRKRFTTVVSRGNKAKNILEIITPLEKISSNNTKSSLEAIPKINSTISNILFDDVIACFYQEGRNSSMPAVEIVGDPKEGENIDNLKNSSSTDLKLTSMAILKDGKLVGYLNEEESLGYSIFRGKAKTINISFPCDDKNNYGSVTVDGVSSDFKTEVKNNIPSASLTIKGRAALIEYNCNTDLTKQKNIDKVENIVNKVLEDIIDSTLLKLQKELVSDNIGFGERLYKDQTKFWKKNKDKWDEMFSNAKFKIISKVTIESMVTTINSAKEAD